MLTTLQNSHLASLRAAINDDYDLSTIADWITTHTYLKGSRYSFADHEFQEFIARCTDRVINVAKCSQIGLSELMARWACGFADTISDSSVIITFPFAGDAADFARTRIDPFIDSSPRLASHVDRLMNNSEIKRINESLIYFRGTNGKTQAISIPADVIISDELDRSDPAVMTQYTSRLTHSKYKLRRNFSTPTIDGWGISLEMETSQRFRNMCKCNHCNEWFLPNYFQHVRIPGFEGELKSITKTNIHKTRYLEAYVECPKCHLVPSLQKEHRNWVEENTLDNFDAKGIYVSPFDAPNVITPTSLIVASTQYARYSEFMNQNLGITSEDVQESITLSDVKAAFTEAPLCSTMLHAMGVDMGLICHICVGRMLPTGEMLVVHRERCTIGELEVRRLALAIKYRVTISVFDSMPYVDVILRLQRTIRNLYAGTYTNSKKVETFSIKMYEGDAAEGKLPLHQALINRDTAFDELLGKFKRREMLIHEQGDVEDELFQKMCLDMKRVQIFDNNQELVFTWQKSKEGQDHYFHALLYLYTACKLRGVSAGNAPIGVPLIARKLRVSQIDQLKHNAKHYAR